ncbi:hypothetical protein CLV71_11747 [Actinophytocola oryzae]|uniref:Fibronectin type-III domain-containing protein n=1 Tax=Actinophytocola oryzae TaxID=502181 RepID=A0A4R7V1Z6_9PSEU|nr:hypothetical protein CLV71_11747 [Actinophytocola oryzae]
MLIWFGAVALIAGAVVTLRATDEPHTKDTKSDDTERPVVVDRYAADYVILPQPGRAPAPPANVVAVPDGATRLRVSWADGLPGGVTPSGATGYEVRWRQNGASHVVLVATPDVLIDHLDEGQRVRVEVRTVDAFGQRSRPAVADGTPKVVADRWRGAMTGMYDDFRDPPRLQERWHLSGYRGCVDVVNEHGHGLPIELGCGADLAVLRARQPMTLTAPDASGELGRVAVRTDTAGTGGELTITLAPGPVDRVGVENERADRFEARDATLPGGTIRVGIDTSGVHVSAAPDVPTGTPGPLQVFPTPARGPGVSHLYEVVLTTAGLRVYQDGLAVAVAGVVPTWQAASVLFGLRGPDQRRSRVHVLSAGFTGKATEVAPVHEVPINAGTQRVLDLSEQSPQLGIARTPLTNATSARLVATVTMAAGMDAGGVVVQLGGIRVPAPAVAPPPTANGAAVTVRAEVPAALLGRSGADSITPFVLRAPGANQQVRVVETYLEVTQAGGGTPPPPTLQPGRTPGPDMLPSIDAVLANSAGEPLTSAVVPRTGQILLDLSLDGASNQWETGSIGGVQGFQVWLDGKLAAGLPTRADGPGLGGRHTLSIATRGLARGAHVMEVREYAMDGTERPQSAVLNFTVR